MPWWQFALLGALGGAIVEALAVFRCAAAWQGARRSPDNNTVKRCPPRLRRYVDVPAHAIVLPTRMLLGAAAAVLCGLAGQVTGSYGAVAVGCVAPVLLAQLGTIPQVAKAVNSVPGAHREAAAKLAAASAATSAEAAVAAGEGSLP